MILAGGDLALQAGDHDSSWVQDLESGPLGQPGKRLAQGWRFQRPGQKASSAVGSRAVGLAVRLVITPPAVSLPAEGVS
jgi:hypothetical protein